MLRLLFLPLLVISAVFGFPMNDHSDEPPSGDPFADPGDISLYHAWKTYKQQQQQQHTRPGVIGVEQVAWSDGLLRGDGGFGSVPVRDRLEAWAGWLNPWGEGELLIFDEAGNISIPHRPAAFPAHLPPANTFPVQGTLLRIEDFPGAKELGVDEYGCAELPLIPSDAATNQHAGTTNTTNLLIALIVRGHCSFSHKTRLAQHLSATAVIVADDTAAPSETEEQGRTRTGLLTMYSPDDTTDIRVGSTFVSRAGWLVVRDLMGRGGAERGVEVRIEPDDGQRQRDRAPKEAVFALPEAIWVPEEWEKEDDSPGPAVTKVVARVAGDVGEHVDAEERGDEGGENDEQEEERRPLFVTGMPKQKPPQSSSFTAIGSGTTTATAKKRKFYSKDECAICLGSFERGDVIRILPCGHLFHKFEVDDWLVKWKKVVSSRFFGDITATPSDSTLAIPAQTATTPLTAVPPATSSDSDAEPIVGGWFGSSFWERTRNVFRNRNRAVEGEEQAEGEETPLLRV
ncbi:hypothetical protein QFC21_004197 [Naganishia friedmannii]|uniref:Uncharacterized protein n=1 Tax=Naganishia friedmannii TaxID=89922 RepID=A0ACC2VKH9_9TREE|nr:hypothetical protein QFC21_004197 [Naganishia friedmannii]